MIRRLLMVLALGLLFVGVSQAETVSGSKISKIEIKGISNADKLLPLLGLKKGDRYSASKVHRAERTILKALKEQGYYGSKVTEEVEANKEGSVLTFRVDKGEKIKIEKVTFVGNKAVKSKDLEEHLVNKKGELGGLLAFLPGFSSGDLVTAQLPYDQLRIREAYLERGYIDAQVRKPEVKIDREKKVAQVTYRIVEGAPYDVGTVRILGNVPGMDRAKVMEDMSLKSGKRFDVRALRKDMRLLQRTVGDLGYAFARIEPRFRKNPAKHTLSVAYEIRPGRKVYVKDVIISGNTKTKDHVVRRYLYLAPGDLYNQSDLEESRKELQRTGYFEKAVIKPQRVSADKVNLVVEVDEAQTGSISGGFGYGSYEGFSINASVSERNLFGTGIAGSVSMDLSKKSHNYAVSLTDPRVLDSLYSLSVGIYHRKFEFIDYTKKSKGGYLSVGRKITRHLSASLGYSYSDTDYSDVKTTLNPNWYQSYRKSSILASLTFDSTDNFFNPREGFYSRLDLEYAGLGGGSSSRRSAKFLRSDFKFGAYYGMEDLLDYDLILRYKLRAGYMVNKGYTPVAEKIYLGGSRYGIRGYETASISPVDADGYRIGGMKSLVNSFEASIPLSMITKNMRLTAFADYGMIGEHKFTEIKRASAGAQIEWLSPFGAIDLIFAKPIGKKAGDRTQVFEFTIGSKF